MEFSTAVEPARDVIGEGQAPCDHGVAEHDVTRVAGVERRHGLEDRTHVTVFVGVLDRTIHAIDLRDRRGEWNGGPARFVGRASGSGASSSLTCPPFGRTSDASIVGRFGIRDR
ncbi:hypothetical protein GCM10027068_28430 [Prescottella soli]